MSIYYNPSIVTNGLVLCLDAANRDSYPGAGTVWTDLSGNGNDGTLTNGPSYSSSNVGGIVFDGTNDYVSIAANTSFNTTNVSVSLWIKLLGSISVDNVLFSKDSGSGYRDYWFYENNGINFLFKNIGTSVIPTASIANSKWHNIVGTYNGTVLSLYFNGNLFDSVNTIQTSTSTGGIAINSYPNGTYFASNKIISIVLIHNRSLSANEVKQNYNATRNRYGV